MIEGWLIDCYPSKKEGRSDPEGGMTFWIKRASDGKSVRIKDTTWRFRVYAAGAACDDPNYLLTRLRPTGLVRSVRVVEKRADIYAKEKEPVLELELNTGDGARKLGETLEGIFKNPSAFSLYNIDILPEQQYFYDKDLFPLAYVRAEVDDNSNIIGWELLDSISSLEYQSPKLKCVRLSLGLSDLVPTFNSHLRSVGISSLSSEEEGADGSFVLDGKNESELIEEAVREIKRLDPDLIVTRNGDSFGFPYLSAKAREFSVSLEGLNRDPDAGEFAHNRADAKTYFSYGKIMYRPATQRLYGRLHLDEENTFVYDQCRLEGLYEVSRLCRIPFHTSMRASIGKCLSSLQFYYASKKDILIPWKPKIAEDFKNGYELLLADRGGLVLEPLRGVFDRVCELDFASLYPSIIRMYNISVETVNCRCCSGLELTEEDQEDIKRDPSRNSLREMGLHICTAERGIVPESLEYPLDKRFEYKKLRDATPDERVKRIFNERAGSLKWILVCCFGYLSYRNAKFGKIDSHIAVCAFARKTLLEAMQTAELRGYRVIHGIVDSLWVRKRDADRKHYEELCDEIASATGFRILLEGIYKWIVFLPSKTSPQNQVANRYFGCFEESNEIKTRGIELRRHDTPNYFRECQGEILLELSTCDTLEQVSEKAKEQAVAIFHKYAGALERHDVAASDLLIRRRLSKELDAYSSRRQLSVNAAEKLNGEGLRLRAGQTISYVITRFRSSGRQRALPEEMIGGGGVEYDSRRYVELLAECCSTILSPFGITKEFLLSRSELLQRN